jgi:hypothetical protein
VLYRNTQFNVVVVCCYHYIFRCLRLFTSCCKPSTDAEALKKMLGKGCENTIQASDENCALMGCYAACSGNSLPTFRDDLSVPYNTLLFNLLFTSGHVFCVPCSRNVSLLREGGHLRAEKYRGVTV